MKNGDFPPAKRCAFVKTNAQRAIYARPGRVAMAYNSPMRPIHFLIATIVAGVCGVSSAQAAAAPLANARQQWLLQARAADVIGEILMDASERAESQVDALRHQLAAANAKAPVTLPTQSPATRESQAAYRAVVDRVIAELQRAAAGGAGPIDPSLDNLPDAQLFNEMTALQTYNLRTFRRLGELRDQAAELRKRLEAAGQAKKGATTRPSIETAEQLAREAIAAIKREPSAEWAEARQKMRNALAGSRARDLRNAATPPPGTPPPPANGGGGGVADDPRWQRYYYGPGEFAGWGGELFRDPFNFHGGGGVYERNDTRVNADFDTRTRGQSDRRVNVESDRRLNVHVDPRQNF